MAEGDKLEHQCLVSDDINFKKTHFLLYGKIFVVTLFSIAKRIRVGAEWRGAFNITPVEYHTQCK